MSKSNDFGLLYKFQYPPYRIICNSLTSFIVCGGGSGSYKSGIPNKIENFDLQTVNCNDKNALPLLKNITFYDTNTKIATCMDIHFNYILTCEKNDLNEYILINKKNSQFNEEDNNEEKNSIKLHRKVTDVFLNDNKDAEINIVKYCDISGSLLIAGGSTGAVKIFQRYNEDKPMDLVLLKEIADVSEGHKQAIIDLDVSPNGEEFVSVCDHPDGKYARVWNISRGVKVTELALTSPRSKKLPIKCQYKFRHCRYGRTFYDTEGSPSSFLLYATHQPSKRNPQSASFLSVWGPTDPGTGTDYQLMDALSLGNNKAPLFNARVKMVPSSLSVADNGLLAAVGSSEGQVDVYRFDPDRRSLSLIYRLPTAHSFIVTDLSFMPTRRVLATGHEFELLSVGMDNVVRYHRQTSIARYRRCESLYCVLCVLLVMLVCDRLLVAVNLW